jgi:hypothetical protein
MAIRTNSRRSITMNCRAFGGLLILAAIAAFPGPAVGDAPVTDDKETGFTSLFNGKDLDGWHIMGGGQFSVKDGVILLNKGGGWLRSDKEYKDFELRLQFRFVEKNANSGIFLRANDDKGPGKAYQVQTMDGDSIGDIYTRDLANPTVKRDAEKLKKAFKPTGQWQEYAITAKGGRLEVKLNGELITVAEGLADQPGYIGPQGEGGVLEFRKIRIRAIK